MFVCDQEIVVRKKDDVERKRKGKKRISGTKQSFKY